MNLASGKQLVPYEVNLQELRIPSIKVKRFWHKDFARAVHFSKSETKLLSQWIGWGCGLYSISYILKSFGIKFDYNEIYAIAQSKYNVNPNGLTPEQLVDVVSEISNRGVMKIKAELVYVDSYEQIQKLIQDKNKRMIADFWDDTFDDPYPSPSDPEAGLKWDSGHYAPVLDIKDNMIMLANSSARYYKYGYGIVGIPYDEFKKLHVDFIHEKQAVNSTGIAKAGLTWFVGLLIVIEKINDSKNTK